jgi:hypothetical protein
MRPNQQPKENTIMADETTVTTGCASDVTCPECRTERAYLNIGRDHIGYCTDCQLSWRIGSNLFSSWMEETEAAQWAAYEAAGISTMRRYGS